MEFMKSYFSNEKIHIKCWLDDSIFMYSYLCCLFMRENCGHWPNGLLFNFLLPYFVYMLSVILISLLIHIIITFAINFSFYVYFITFSINFSFC